MDPEQPELDMFSESPNSTAEDFQKLNVEESRLVSQLKRDIRKRYRQNMSSYINQQVVEPGAA